MTGIEALKELAARYKARGYREPEMLTAFIQELTDMPDAKTTPGGNKTLPRCETPDCVNQASFIINDRALCSTCMQLNPVPPSLRRRT